MAGNPQQQQQKQQQNQLPRQRSLSRQSAAGPLSDFRCEWCQSSVSKSISGFLCHHCEEVLRTPYPACSQCGELLNNNERRCQHCQQTPPAFDYTHIFLPYQTPVSHWLRQAKDRRRYEWLLRLGHWMAHHPPAAITQVDALVYVPSDWRKRLWRGFNPARIICEQLASRHHKPILHQALRRRGSTPQRGQHRASRLQQARQQFDSGQQSLHGMHLLLIDDVLTTGATADAVATLLKQQGAAIVGVWALARTPPPGMTMPLALHGCGLPESQA
ncbi:MULTISPECIES: ComF family protein [unclassified Oceanobacter]|uniref:ComF family protein n=1 Tax=unclassified Oceanobacter TaxID=2620260 RepID=UPI002733B88D|nr:MULTISPECIES: ComF family protein [unclassified Oceanobacter]MDP2505729.1 ComF family protein [Oceanobacter sp. 3_MG-2023]MDP2547444.1 ComF family protein [Oceanobacter sp. 4_MG-2023]